MINSPFFQQFLKMSNFYTVVSMIVLVVLYVIMNQLKKRKFSFSKRMLVGLVMGLVLGFSIDLIGSTNPIYLDYARAEISAWFSLFGRGFVKLIQLMAVPVVFLSIINVVIDVEGDRIKRLTGKTFATLLSTTAIAAAIGIFVVKLFGLEGSNFTGDLSSGSAEYMENIASQSFPEFFLELIPNNIISVMGDNASIVSVVIIAGLLASAIRFLKTKSPEKVEPLISFLDSLRETMNSTLMNIIKLMPYGVVALIANTIISNGVQAILGVVGFIVAIYTAIILMMLVYVVILLVLGLNPITFYRKAYTTIVFAFSSRSSVGTLPYTLKTLTEDLGVSKQTANFVGTLGTSIGLNGCAGVFPAMLGTLVAASLGVELNFSFFILIILVVTVGSIGIAGVPGTATVAATVTLNGLGFGAAMSHIGSIFGIDPIIDMGRTALNVTGSMISAIFVDNWEGSLNRELYNDMDSPSLNE